MTIRPFVATSLAAVTLSMLSVSAAAASADLTATVSDPATIMPKSPPSCPNCEIKKSDPGD